jgi:hypothetical protein
MFHFLIVYSHFELLRRMTNKKTGGRTAADAPITSRSVATAILKHNFCLGVKRLNKKKDIDPI